MDGAGGAHAHGDDYAEFLARHPGYRDTTVLDQLRATEYQRLDRHRHVYLDYTGGTLYGTSQLAQHQQLLADHIYGNPHSHSPASLAMTERVESARAAVLRYFNALPDEYFAIFTPNASGALKHVGECYPFGAGARYLLTFDNHNSVNGIREFARSRGAAVTYVPLVPEDLRIDRQALAAELSRSGGEGARLFAFPAQSNFSGVQHPLTLIEEAQAAGWDVLLDAAAFVPTNRLDLSRWKPDLVCVSFYKMFGYPTGVGCLLMRKPMFPKFRRPWFAGGTVQIASVQGDGHFLAPDAAAFEDGTVDYLNLPAVEIGLRHLDSIGIDRIHERVMCLTGWLLEEMTALRHASGRPLVEIHGPATAEQRGGTIAFNFVDPSGRAYDIRRVEELAAAAGISLRTGCFCNPGAGEVAFRLRPEELAGFFQAGEGMGFHELRDRIRQAFDKEIGSARISVGLASNFADAAVFMRFARGFLDRPAAEVGAPADAASCQAMTDSP
ncbi:MAG TPA: aminotransferase class V-fold PLP-dependent enzyme [Gemmatimonadales bacterium]|nr:aminotransferase class V-fold PLP-dependent enzyme [Gemmatimonadales bacterium]